MLEVKSPWNHKLLGKIEYNNAEEIESIIQQAYKKSLSKGLDFPLKDRIQILTTFSEKIKNNSHELAKLAASEGGKPIEDSIIEIIRGSEGVDSAIENLKSESGNAIPI